MLIAPLTQLGSGTMIARSWHMDDIELACDGIWSALLEIAAVHVNFAIYDAFSLLQELPISARRTRIMFRSVRSYTSGCLR